MTEQEAYQEHIRYTHDTYCRIVIRHASFDAARMLAARWRREISLEYLTEEKFVPLSTTDEYFQVPDYGETYLFSVRGQTIFLDSCSLAAALAGLPEQTQEEIFLYYFQHLTQKEIGEQSGWTRSTIGRHIQLMTFLTSASSLCLSVCLSSSTLFWTVLHRTVLKVSRPLSSLMKSTSCSSTSILQTSCLRFGSV